MRRLLFAAAVVFFAVNLFAGKAQSKPEAKKTSTSSTASPASASRKKAMKLIPTTRLLSQYGVRVGTKIFDFYKSKINLKNDFIIADGEFSTVLEIHKGSHIKTEKRFIDDLGTIAVLGGTILGFTVGEKVIEKKSKEKMILKGIFFDGDFLICIENGFCLYEWRCKKARDISYVDPDEHEVYIGRDDPVSISDGSVDERPCKRRWIK